MLQKGRHGRQLQQPFGLLKELLVLDKWTDDIKSNAIKTEAEVRNLRKVLKEYGKVP